MIKGLKIGIITSISILAVTSVPLFVLLKHKIETQYQFNLSDIITYCDGKENTLDYFKDTYANEMFYPTQAEIEKWDTTISKDALSMLSLGVVKRMTREQLSYDIAFWVSNWWQKNYNYQTGNPGQPPVIPFLPGYSEWDSAEKIWKKQWSFIVNVEKLNYIHNDIECSFNINFHCDSWKDQMYWASHNNCVNSVSSDGYVNVVDALILTSGPLINDGYLYHINTFDLPLWNDKNRVGPEYLKVERFQCYGNTWVDEGYGNFGGPDGQGPNAFKMESFIMNNYHVLM